MLRLVIRADGGASIGTGHIMRCIALTEAWRDVGGDVLFVTRCPIPSVVERIRRAGAATALIDGDKDDTEVLCDAATPGSLIVLDGYEFDEMYQQKVRRLGSPVAMIDDQALCTRYWADVIINQNLGAECLRYSCDRPARLLLGSKYALLRKEFRQRCCGQKAIVKEARKILITLGGSDAGNVTSRVVDAVATLGGRVEVLVVVGAASRYKNELQRKLRVTPNMRMVVDLRDMSEAMSWADLAITAAGSTCWELAYLRTPFVAIVTAANQRGVAQAMCAYGAAAALGDGAGLGREQIACSVESLLLDQDRRERLSACAGALVDGAGVMRVVEVLLSL